MKIAVKAIFEHLVQSLIKIKSYFLVGGLYSHFKQERAWEIAHASLVLVSKLYTREASRMHQVKNNELN